MMHHAICMHVYNVCVRHALATSLAEQHKPFVCPYKPFVVDWKCAGMRDVLAICLYVSHKHVSNRGVLR